MLLGSRNLSSWAEAMVAGRLLMRKMVPLPPSRRWRRIRVQHLLNRFAQLAFGIEHELPRCHDALAFLQSAEHLVGIVVRTRHRA